MSRIFESLNNLSTSSIGTNEGAKMFHPLAYEWCFWQHNRINTQSKSANTSLDPDNILDSSNIHNSDSGIENTDELENENGNSLINDTTAVTTPNNARNATNKIRDVQYLQETTLLKFPKIYSDNDDEQTSEISSVEQFWLSYVNLKKLVNVPVDTEYFFFKKSIKPLWEDSSNKRGGRWSLNFTYTQEYHTKFMTIFWELLLFKLVSGKFLDDESIKNFRDSNDNVKLEISSNELNKLVMDDLAGIIVSIRSKKIILNIWNTHLSYDKFCKEHQTEDSNLDGDYHYNCEKNNEKIKELYGLTYFKFRKLITDTINNTMNEAIDLLIESTSDNDHIKENNLFNELKNEYKQKAFKYSFHFDPIDNNGNTSNKKNKLGNGSLKTRKKENSKKNFEMDKMNTLGKLRKKIEFNKEGLLIEELNVANGVPVVGKPKATWARRRRNVSRSGDSDII